MGDVKALAFDRYTDSAGVTVRELPDPTAGPDQVLVRVAAVGLNAWDWHQYQGKPTIMRLQTGLRVKEPRILGADIAGTVVALGDGVTSLAVGDRVMGEVGLGGAAQLVAAAADALVAIPDSVEFATAAGAPMCGHTALQSLRDAGGLRPGGRVLVWGASGGVGHFAVQVAKALGASWVDAVCSGANTAMVAGLGADATHDYTRSPQPDGPFDVIIDTVATQSLGALAALLAPGGRIVTVGALGGGSLLGPAGAMVRRTVAGKVRRIDHRMMFAQPRQEDLALLAGWLADGTVRPVIQAVRPLSSAGESLAELEAGHVAGKLVLTVL
jgi:NADPH:quinone reductase-like Zn-dependent oxidoreductase